IQRSSPGPIFSHMRSIRAASIWPVSRNGRRALGIMLSCPKCGSAVYQWVIVTSPEKQRGLLPRQGRHGQRLSSTAIDPTTARQQPVAVPDIQRVDLPPEHFHYRKVVAAVLDPARVWAENAREQRIEDARRHEIRGWIVIGVGTVAVVDEDQAA